MPLITTNKTDAHPQKRQAAALTLIELLAIIAIIAILIGLLLPARLQNNQFSLRIKCVSHLKQIGIGYRLWAGDNQDRYPMQILVTNGETIEYQFPPVAAEIFGVLSNKLCDPRILLCPADSDRVAATNFLSKLANAQISYFVGLEADETRPQSLLSGDRNLTNGTELHNGILELTPDRPPGWTEKIHRNQGNILVGDGSVQQYSTSALLKQLSHTGMVTNRLAMP